MSAFLHCMICFEFPSKNVKFYFASCAHVACFRCVKNGCFTLKCKICKKENPRILEINEKLPPEIADLFMPVEDSMKKINEDMARLFDFQQMHRDILMNSLDSRSGNLDKLKEIVQNEVKRKDNYKKELMKQEAFAKHQNATIAKLKGQIAAATAHRLTPLSNTHAQDRSLNLTAMTHDPFRTPAPRGGHRSFTTSTPIADASIAPGDGTTFDASLSFSTATGLPKSMNNTGDVSMLVNQTKGFNLNGSTLTADSGGIAYKKPSNHGAQEKPHIPGFHGDQRVTTQRADTGKSKNLSMLSMTDPMPMK